MLELNDDAVCMLLDDAPDRVGIAGGGREDAIPGRANQRAAEKVWLDAPRVIADCRKQSRAATRDHDSAGAGAGAQGPAEVETCTSGGTVQDCPGARTGAGGELVNVPPDIHLICHC